VSKQYDVVIIGAGIIGASIAFSLARSGKKTLNIDALPASGYGSTSGSCAIIRPYYSTIETSAIAHESHRYWSDWSELLDAEDERGHIQYHAVGCLVAKTENNDYLRPTMAILDAIGAPYEELDPEQYVARMPIFNVESYTPAKRPEDDGFGEPNGKQIGGGVYMPEGGYVSDPQLATHNLQRAAEAKGGEFLFNAKVASIRQEGGRIVGITLVSGEQVDAPVVVNAAGPHSSKINAMVDAQQDMKITTRALRHEVAHVPSPAGFDFEKQGCVCSDSDIHTYCRPETGNHILIGSEDPACDSKDWVDPDDYNKDFTDQWRVQALRMGQRIQSLPIPNQAKGVVELYDVTPDWAPIYDKSCVPGFYMAIGTSGNQFKNAPIVGDMMQQLIDACEQGQDHDLQPVVFKLKYSGRAIDLSIFSRNRNINPNSSGTVLG
jgi:sarcosine oxidase subunit beta